MLYFFLSYARGDDDEFVRTFYADLCTELRARAGLRGTNDQIGFFDSSSIGLGQTWSTQLVEALSTCQVLLSLGSPAYFGSEPCGKEWQVFAQRVAEYNRSTRTIAPAIFPLRWIPMPDSRMHPSFTRLQNHTERLGESYRESGLRQLMRIQRFHDDYLEFVSELADLITETVTNHRIPKATTELTFNDITSAFHQQSKGDHTVRTLDVPGVPASQYVHFVVAAPTRAEIANVRQQVVFYGEQSVDWAPYQPTFPFPLGEYALGIATDHSFRAEVASIDNLSERLDRAAENNQIVVLLVDAWVTSLEYYREALVQYSEREQTHSEQTTAVMIPWNHYDEETQAHKSELTFAIRGVFYRRSAGGEDVMYRPSILSRDAFEADLRVVLEVAKNHIFVNGKVYRRPTGKGPEERPNLAGP